MSPRDFPPEIIIEIMHWRLIRHYDHVGTKPGVSKVVMIRPFLKIASTSKLGLEVARAILPGLDARLQDLLNPLRVDVLKTLLDPNVSQRDKLTAWLSLGSVTAATKSRLKLISDMLKRIEAAGTKPIDSSQGSQPMPQQQEGH
ncbi:MAG: hypothetical protein Q9162_005894 [Coniocarpon cinnabarinum]